MRLADFIETNVAPIMDAWVDFARDQGSDAGELDLPALRDHAVAMLSDFVADLREPETSRQQDEKSKGRGAQGIEDTAAALHGATREAQGFTADEMVSEFRALRASVVKLYRAAHGANTQEEQDDIVRFHEAVDQALAESVARFTLNIDQSRDTLVAVLGHDLRTPLNAVLIVMQHLLGAGGLDGDQHALVQRAVRSARRMNGMIDDVVEFTRSRIGVGNAVTRSAGDLAPVLLQAVDELRTLAPSAQVTVHLDDDLNGNWDAPRLEQAFGNLLGNAEQHGERGRPIVLTARAAAAEVVISFHNFGPPIPSEDIPGLFAPFKRLTAGEPRVAAGTRMGLGLYIADRIIAGHGGSIAVTSTVADGTLFTVTLPL